MFRDRPHIRENIILTQNTSTIKAFYYKRILTVYDTKSLFYRV